MIIVIEGNISQETEDKVVAMGAASGSLNRHGSGKQAFYHIQDDDDVDFDGDDISIDVDSFDNGAYFSFAVKNKLIVTSKREQMEALLANKGRFEGVRSERGQLFVLSAERGLIQAGARTVDFDGNGSWDSNILRNTEHAALLVRQTRRLPLVLGMAARAHARARQMDLTALGAAPADQRDVGVGASAQRLSHS